MIRTWPYVVLIDTTYKTNKPKWPLCEVIGMTPTNHNFLVAFCLMRDEAAVSYSWVLQGLRDIFGTAQTPSVIVTDRDEGLSAAIRDVFPDVRHLLCTWHIGNDVENMVDKLCGGKKNQQGQLFRKSRWNPLVESATIREYEKRWEGIVSTWSVRNRRVVRYLTGTWIPLREKFVRESMTSVPRTLRQYFFRPLYRHVSLYALEQIQNEFNRMLEMGDFVLNKCDDPGGRDFSQFPWPDYIPFMLPSYLFDWIDVAQYLTLYLSQESLDESIFRVGSHTDGPAPFMHWFDAPMAFYSAATCLILPLRKA
ncbi:protein FAR1-RELATED SEQUENCE 2-like [Amaranthus tricolor]|uniref:protein FAR1-RELATED SEQUENCE 2-like n=1 Tax=Amaranthus tricolor TaxID=29722 RepID=UPI002582851F|nr:protein FAR1-RELATED SEQUENCE 2-like [Amaranthus tricolor]